MATSQSPSPSGQPRRRLARFLRWPHVERRVRKHRRGDYMMSIAVLISALLSAGGYLALHIEDNKRISDLVAGCHKNSQRTAADVALNWVYYESEVQLAREPRSKPAEAARARALAQLTPAERNFIGALSDAANVHALEVRAQADYDAAYYKAITVDTAYVGLIPLRNGLGSGRTPRSWVMKAGYSCAKAYR